MHTNALIYTNIGKAQISETDTHFKISGIPITKNDSVMNGVAYFDGYNRKGMPTLVEQPITLRHPLVNGVNVSAKQGKGLNYFSGTLIESEPYLESNKWKVDVQMNKKKLAAQDDGERWTEILSNKEMFGVSTGLTFEMNTESGELNGEKYRMVAKGQNYDHLAFLDPQVEAPAGGEDTMVTFNSAVAEGEVVMCNIDNEPEEKPVEQPLEDKTESIVNRALTAFAKRLGISYNSQEFNTNQDEDYAMRKIIEAKLQAAGIEVNGLDETALLEAYNSLNAPKEPEQKPQTNSDETPAWAKSLVAKVNSLESQLTANAEKELDEIASQVAELNMGVNKDIAKAMGVEGCKNFLAANGKEYVAEGYAAPQARSTNSSKDADTSYDMPE